MCRSSAPLWLRSDMVARVKAAMKAAARAMHVMRKAPICGCDDTTYDNACESQKANVTVKHGGK